MTEARTVVDEMRILHVHLFVVKSNLAAVPPLPPGHTPGLPRRFACARMGAECVKQ